MIKPSSHYANKAVTPQAIIDVRQPSLNPLKLKFRLSSIFIPYRKQDMIRLCFKYQLLNAGYGNNFCLF